MNYLISTFLLVQISLIKSYLQTHGYAFTQMSYLESEMLTFLERILSNYTINQLLNQMRKAEQTFRFQNETGFHF